MTSIKAKRAVINLGEQNLHIDGFVSLSELDMLPQSSGIYFVYECADRSDSEVLIYVGISKNLRTRWKSHHKRSRIEAYKEVTLYYSLQSESSLGALEKLAIEKLRPVLNDITTWVDSKSISARKFRCYMKDMATYAAKQVLDMVISRCLDVDPYFDFGDWKASYYLEVIEQTMSSAWEEKHIKEIVGFSPSTRMFGEEGKGYLYAGLLRTTLKY